MVYSNVFKHVFFGDTGQDVEGVAHLQIRPYRSVFFMYLYRTLYEYAYPCRTEEYIRYASKYMQIRE